LADGLSDGVASMAVNFLGQIAKRTFRRLRRVAAMYFQKAFTCITTELDIHRPVLAEYLGYSYL
jgi:hypothetical protein